MLKEVYINLLGEKEPKLNLESNEVIVPNISYNAARSKNISRKIVKLDEDELRLHKKYIKTQLQKNNYN